MVSSNTQKRTYKKPRHISSVGKTKTRKKKEKKKNTHKLKGGENNKLIKLLETPYKKYEEVSWSNSKTYKILWGALTGVEMVGAIGVGAASVAGAVGVGAAGAVGVVGIISGLLALLVSGSADILQEGSKWVLDGLLEGRTTLQKINKVTFTIGNIKYHIIYKNIEIPLKTEILKEKLNDTYKKIMNNNKDIEESSIDLNYTIEKFINDYTSSIKDATKTNKDTFTDKYLLYYSEGDKSSKIQEISIYTLLKKVNEKVYEEVKKYITERTKYIEQEQSNRKNKIKPDRLLDPYFKEDNKQLKDDLENQIKSEVINLSYLPKITLIPGASEEIEEEDRLPFIDYTYYHYNYEKKVKYYEADSVVNTMTNTFYDFIYERKILQGESITHDNMMDVIKLESGCDKESLELEKITEIIKTTKEYNENKFVYFDKTGSNLDDKKQNYIYSILKESYINSSSMNTSLYLVIVVGNARNIKHLLIYIRIKGKGDKKEIGIKCDVMEEGLDETHKTNVLDWFSKQYSQLKNITSRIEYDAKINQEKILMVRHSISFHLFSNNFIPEEFKSKLSTTRANVIGSQIDDDKKYKILDIKVISDDDNNIPQPITIDESELETLKAYDTHFEGNISKLATQIILEQIRKEQNPKKSSTGGTGGTGGTGNTGGTGGTGNTGGTGGTGNTGGTGGTGGTGDKKGGGYQDIIGDHKNIFKPNVVYNSKMTELIITLFEDLLGILKEGKLYSNIEEEFGDINEDEVINIIDKLEEQTYLEANKQYRKIKDDLDKLLEKQTTDKKKSTIVTFDTSITDNTIKPQLAVSIVALQKKTANSKGGFNKNAQMGGDKLPNIVKTNINFCIYILQQYIKRIFDIYTIFNLILHFNVNIIGNNIGYFESSNDGKNTYKYKGSGTDNIVLDLSKLNKKTDPSVNNYNDNDLCLLFFKPMNDTQEDNNNTHFVLIFTGGAMKDSDGDTNAKLFVGMIYLGTSFVISYKKIYIYNDTFEGGKCIISFLTTENKAMPCFFSDEGLFPIPALSLDLNQFKKDKLDHLKYIEKLHNQPKSVMDVNIVNSCLTNIINRGVNQTNYISDIKYILGSHKNMKDEYNDFFNESNSGDKLKFFNFNGEIAVTMTTSELETRYKKCTAGTNIINLAAPSEPTSGSIDYDKMEKELFKVDYFFDKNSDIIDLNLLISKLDQHPENFNVILALLSKYHKLIFNSLLNSRNRDGTYFLKEITENADNADTLFLHFMKHMKKYEDNTELNLSFDNVSKTFKEAILKQLVTKMIPSKDKDYRKSDLEAIEYFLDTKVVSSNEKIELLMKIRKLITLKQYKESKTPSSKPPIIPPPKKGGNSQYGGTLKTESINDKLLETTAGRNIVVMINEIWENNGGVGNYFDPSEEDMSAQSNIKEWASKLNIDGIKNMLGEGCSLDFNSITQIPSVVCKDGVKYSLQEYFKAKNKMDEFINLEGHANIDGGVVSLLGELATPKQKEESKVRVKEMLKRDKDVDEKIKEITKDLDILLKKITAGNSNSFEAALFKIDTYLIKLEKLEKMFKPPKEDEKIPKAKKEELDTTFNPEEIGATPDTLLIDSRLTSEKISNIGMYKEIINTKYTLLKNYSDSMNLKTTAFPTFVNNVYKPPSSIGSNSLTTHGPKEIIIEFLLDFSSKPQEDIKLPQYINIIPSVVNDINLLENIIRTLPSDQAIRALFRLYTLRKTASTIFNPQKPEFLEMIQSQFDFKELNKKYPNYPLFEKNFLWYEEIGAQTKRINMYEFDDRGPKENRLYTAKKEGNII